MLTTTHPINDRLAQMRGALKWLSALRTHWRPQSIWRWRCRRIKLWRADEHRRMLATAVEPKNGPKENKKIGNFKLLI
jgi:hypothetical protein